MCGIAGYVRPQGLQSPAVLERMIAALRHRGPDGDGDWSDLARGVALGHTRLKVLDLTAAADQPMRLDPGPVVLTYNGEIYNFAALRRELEQAGARFGSTGDTAVLAELCRRDAALSFLPRLNGMFAFAVWDGRSGTLTLARDRTGVKPLLWAELPGGGVAFASEMAALRVALGEVSLAIDPHAAVQLLTLGFIGAPRTIFAQVRRLEPGQMLTWRDGRIALRRWAPPRPASASVADFEAAKQALREQLRAAVVERLVADVPVGVFLSGGIDSSIVTALAALYGGSEVRTFSVGFPGEPAFDETHYAAAVAQRYRTRHTVLPLSIDDIRAAIPTVLDRLSEPFADSSALPTYLLSRATRQHVTVALSGDGADELFAGYRRYAATRLVERFGWFAATPLYGPCRAAVERLPTRRETRFGSKVSQLKRAVRGLDRRRPARHANWMRITDDRALGRLLAHGDAGEHVRQIEQYLWSHRGEPRDGDDLNAHLATEWRTSLPDDMLTKIDLMSMASALEVRSPFLDFRVADLVAPLPAEWKLSGWRKKFLLIEAFRAELPELLHDRPKQGFEVPVGPWLRGPLHGLARELIESDKVFAGPLLSRGGALALLEEHRTGRADHTSTLWSLVALLSWSARHGGGVGQFAVSAVEVGAGG
ncbi:MAG: asparagine synthase (glutamine-hydrolyzing) [Phycisphaerae bacterium]